jgi:hypothetical protein
MFDDWDALGEAAEAYEKAFGELPPLIEMPGGPAEQLALIRAALESGQPYAASVPEGAVI